MGFTADRGHRPRVNLLCLRGCRGLLAGGVLQWGLSLLGTVVAYPNPPLLFSLPLVLAQLKGGSPG